VAQHGARVVPLTLEVTKPAEITAAAEAANDVTLVNNAGVATGFGAALTDPAIIVNGKTERDVNVLGTPQAARAQRCMASSAGMRMRMRVKTSCFWC